MSAVLQISQRESLEITTALGGTQRGSQQQQQEEGRLSTDARQPKREAAPQRTIAVARARAGHAPSIPTPWGSAVKEQERFALRSNADTLAGFDSRSCCTPKEQRENKKQNDSKQRPEKPVRLAFRAPPWQDPPRELPTDTRTQQRTRPELLLPV
ncbi:unnamed protein product [Lampetra fluviatilis]